MALNHDCGDNTAAYVLGALDARELDGFRLHLASCSVCQAEVESLQQTVNVLPEAVTQYAAPAALRRSIMSAVRDDALRTAQVAPAQRPRFSVGGMGNASGGIWPDWARVPLARNHGGLVGVGIALVLVLVVVVVGVTAGGTHTRASAPEAHVYSASTGSAELVVTGHQGQLIVHKLKQLSPTRTYEVWLERGTSAPEPTSATFNVSANGDDAVKIPEPLTGVTAVLVTNEYAGGSSKPTTKPVVVADIG